ncbi:hypothetical protein P8A24_07600 [Arcanobacterium wilhelmae]|uniref:hypothetical protein n=1 Tax=Arcanobacterium wilhelmae TaxID=1803177 RepID=UPI0024151BBC|nr:hypothetical protein [Arcanobacterium wilhelmae]WFN90050.1 hypothetical protein P8A24_07600 [Arcanobacterium wilhelmae]
MKNVGRRRVFERKLAAFLSSKGHVGVRCLRGARIALNPRIVGFTMAASGVGGIIASIVLERYVPLEKYRGAWVEKSSTFIDIQEISLSILLKVSLQYPKQLLNMEKT